MSVLEESRRDGEFAVIRSGRSNTDRNSAIFWGEFDECMDLGLELDESSLDCIVVQWDYANLEWTNV
jgi:hypothetical protein